MVAKVSLGSRSREGSMVDRSVVEGLVVATVDHGVVVGGLLCCVVATVVSVGDGVILDRPLQLK
jgi:tetrahydrodipicolinate N-succinyltransferase